MVVPDGLEMRRLRLAVAGRSEDGHKPEVLAGGGEASLRPLGSATGSFHELTWEGESGRRLEARLRCAGAATAVPARTRRSRSAASGSA